MNYKKLLSRVIGILTNPTNTWKEIDEEKETIDVQSTFVYPMIALCGLAMFVGMLFGNGVDTFNLQVVLTKCCGLFVSLFGGYFLSSYLINHFIHYIIGEIEIEDKTLKTNKLVGYSMGVTFVLHIFSSLLPSLLILRWILQFYTVFIVWEGAKELMKVAENKLLSYTITTSIIILVTPAIMGKVFALLCNFG